MEQYFLMKYILLQKNTRPLLGLLWKIFQFLLVTQRELRVSDSALSIAEDDSSSTEAKRAPIFPYKRCVSSKPPSLCSGTKQRLELPSVIGSWTLWLNRLSWKQRV